MFKLEYKLFGPSKPIQTLYRCAWHCAQCISCTSPSSQESHWTHICSQRPKNALKDYQTCNRNLLGALSCVKSAQNTPSYAPRHATKPFLRCGDFRWAAMAVAMNIVPSYIWVHSYFDGASKYGKWPSIPSSTHYFAYINSLSGF